MVIEEKDFRLTPVSEFSPFYDLELLYTIKPRGKEPRQEFKCVAYGLTIENAVDRIVNYRLHCKYDKLPFNNWAAERAKMKESFNNLLCGKLSSKD